MSDLGLSNLSGNRKTSAWDSVLNVFLPFRKKTRALEEEKQRLEAFLQAVPIEYCGWDTEGMQAISPGFSTIFGLDTVSSIEDLDAAVTAGDAAALQGLFDRLCQYGETFEIGVNTVIGKKTLRIFGKRGALMDGSQVFSVIWVQDITNYADAAMRSMEAVKVVEERENELRAALNMIPFPVWMRDQELDLTWCNKSYTRVVDDTAAAVIADQKEMSITGPGRKILSQRALAQKAIAKGDLSRVRGHMVVEGQRRMVDIIETPISSNKKMVGVALDVTKEEELESSYKRLAASHNESLEQLRTAIAMFDVDTRLEFYNSAYEELTGMPGSWLDSRPKLIEIIDKMRELRKLPDQADYKQFKDNWLHQFTTLIDPYEEMQYLPDGSVLRMIVVPRPMGGFLITLEDVTSRLQLETSYNTLMEVQKETMDNLAEGIAVFGEDGLLRLSNRAFSKIWDIPAEDMTEATHITEIIDHMKGSFEVEDWPEARQVLLGNGLERTPRGGTLSCLNGTVLEYSVVPLPDGNILNSYFDVTDTVKVEQALMEKNTALEAAEKLKTDFLANVSYQLRTPLNAIIGFAEMLQKQYFGKLNERQLEYTSGVLEAGQRLVSLVNDILDLSSIEAGYLSLYPSEINVKDLMERVANLTEDWARKQRLEIKIECRDSELDFVADERRVKQLLLNLISNAINYSPDGGEIILSAEQDGDFVLLGVRDYGVGISKEDLQRVFTPFEKIHTQRVQRQSGAGLGLSLVRRIADLHGGDVNIESEEGKGTFVTCRLPLEQSMIPDIKKSTADD